MAIQRGVIPTGAQKQKRDLPPVNERCYRCSKRVKLTFSVLLCDSCLDWEIAYLQKQNATHGKGLSNGYEDRD